MNIICISRGSFCIGKAFAESLAAKLGCPCVSREELVELATKAGVAAGRLEMACLKSRNLDERMVLEREHYQAFITSALCERALDGPVVYHGRTGHLLLQGISHVLRVRVVTDPETRIKSVQDRLGMPRDKAKRYIDQVDEDRRQWVRTFYNIEWDTSSAYDFTLNLEHASVDNVAAAFCSVVKLPEFQETPCSRRALEDLLLGSRCRAVLARDERTYSASFRVSSQRGTISVTYSPRHASVAELIPRVLEGIPGIEQILCTMASTRVLWVQEHFDPKTEVFKHLLEVAEKWDAAVELLRLDLKDEPTFVERASDEKAASPAERSRACGIEAEPESVSRSPRGADEGGMAETFAELVRTGHAGGRVTVHGRAADVLTAIDRTVSYSLVVVGETFLGKGKAAQVRLTREFASTLREQLRVPVIQAEEMKEQFLFGSRQLTSLLVYLSLTALIYFYVFSHQEQVIRIMLWEGTGWRVLAAAMVAVFIPLVAYFYGSAVRSVLKLIRME